MALKRNGSLRKGGVFDQKYPIAASKLDVFEPKKKEQAARSVSVLWWNSEFVDLSFIWLYLVGLRQQLDDL